MAIHQRTEKGPGLASPVDEGLGKWRLSPKEHLTIAAEQFGVVVWDPVWSLYRLITGYGMLMHSYISLDGYHFFGAHTHCFALGAGGAFDEKSCDVPYVWYEAGKARPWRMIYRGIKNADSTCRIGFATAVDVLDKYTLIFERKDCAGNAITDPIIDFGGAGLWDNANLDFGSCIKHRGVYYLYYDTIGEIGGGYGRATGLMTGIEPLAPANWKRHAGNPLFKVSGKGYFCPDTVRWDAPDGSERFVMMIPRMNQGGTFADLEVFTSRSPDFSPNLRTSVGIGFDPTGLAMTDLGIAQTSTDTPHIIVPGAERDVTPLVRAGTPLRSFVSVAPTAASGYVTRMIEHDGALAGAVLSAVSPDLNGEGRRFETVQNLADAHVCGLWLPGLTRSGRDFGPSGYHLTRPIGAQTGMSLSGRGIENLAALTMSPAAQWYRDNTQFMDVLNNIGTGDFTVEFSLRLDTQINNDQCTPLQYASSLKNKFRIYAISNAGPTLYQLAFYCCDTADADQALTGSTNIPAASLAAGIRVSCVRIAGVLNIYVDGVLYKSGAFAHDIKKFASGTSVYFNVGGGVAGEKYFDGAIDEILVTDDARHAGAYDAAAYAAATFAIPRATRGVIYTRVYDLGVARTAWLELLNTLTPAGTGLTVRARAAASATDQSSTLAAFSTGRVMGRYVQFAIVLDGTAALSASIQGAKLRCG